MDKFSKKKMLNYKNKMIIVLVVINIIWISVFGGMIIVLNGPCNPAMFRPSSACPEIYIDNEDDANIYFVSYINDASGSYDVAYVKFDSGGNIVDGPKFVENSSVNDYYETSEKQITDSDGNRYVINIRVWGVPEWNFNDTAYIIYTKIGANNETLIENKTIASHEMISCGFGSHAPSIFGIHMSLDSKDNLHIVWYVNRGPGNYFEVYYMKLDEGGNILVPQTRLYVYDYEKLAGFIGVLAVVPVFSFVFYLLRYKYRRYENDSNHPDERNKEPEQKR